MPCVLQLSLRGNLGQYVMHISCRYQCTGNAIFGPVEMASVWKQRIYCLYHIDLMMLEHGKTN